MGAQNYDYAKVPIRASLIPTTSYVAGNILDGGEGQTGGLLNYNQLVLLAEVTKGSLTSAEIKVEFSDSKQWDLAYDGQSANFTVGATVTGATSKAFGVIVKDTDGGATGTLVIAGIKGTFQNNEELTDDNSTPGVAVVNDASGVNEDTATSDNNWHQETFSAISGGTSTDSLGEHTVTASGKYRIAIPLKDRFVRVSSKGTGTVTNSLMAIDAIIGNV